MKRRHALIIFLMFFSSWSLAQKDDADHRGFEQPFGCSLAEYVQGDVEVHFVGAYSAREVVYRIEESNHKTTQMDILVNLPGKKVALLFGGYDPIIWNVGWTAGTQIVAVAATGHHTQVITGVDKSTPYLATSRDDGRGCGGTHEYSDEVQKTSMKIFGKPVTKNDERDTNAVAMVGPVIRENTQIISSKTNTPAQFAAKDGARAGQDGLDDALKAGLIRLATGDDMKAWLNLMQKKYDPDKPPMQVGIAPRNSYVVLKEFTYPPGLSNSATFFIPKGVPKPGGFKENCTVYNFNTEAAE